MFSNRQCPTMFIAITLLLCASFVAGGCSAPQVQTSRLGAADLVAMTDQMTASLLASQAVADASADAPKYFVIDRAMNRTSDVIPQRELWAFLARLQSQLGASPDLRDRGIRFVLPAERARELNVSEGYGTNQRIPPTHALTATFYSLSHASREARSDAYLCEFVLINLQTDIVEWQDKYEVKYGVIRNKLD